MDVVISPLRVRAGKKDFILNLNNYRNAHYQLLNRSKKNYKAIMSNQILMLPKMNKITITFILYPKTKRRTDLSNVLSIHDKYFCDALVELGKLPDDDYTHIADISYKFGIVDKNNPRVEIEITKII